MQTQIVLDKKPADTNIVLIGFMGCGKSTYARKMAKILRKEYVDTDAIIESEQKESCKQIISTRGEEAFRKLECELLERLAERKNCIIATGGGFARLQNLRKMGFVVWLYLSYEKTAARLANDTKRPLFNERSKELFASRLGSYERECELKVNVLSMRPKNLASVLACFIQLPGIEPAKMYKEKFLFAKEHKSAQLFRREAASRELAKRGKK